LYTQNGQPDFFIELPRFTEERTEKSWGETEGKTQCLD